MHITQEQLKEKLYYKEDGILYWRANYSSRARKDSPAGCLSPKGYVLLRISKVLYKAHRLVWLYHKGYLPEGQIDHEDRVRNNNRIDNLREASQVCQSRNMRLRDSNTSGIKGVYFDKNMGKYVAQIKVNFKHLHLGCFREFDEAVCYRLAAEQSLNWKGCENLSPAFVYVEKMCGRVK